MEIIFKILSFLCLILAVIHLKPIFKGKKYGAFGLMMCTYAFLVLQAGTSDRFLNLTSNFIANASLKYNISIKFLVIFLALIIFLIYFLLFIPYFILYEKERAKAKLKWWETIWKLP